VGIILVASHSYFNTEKCIISRLFNIHSYHQYGLSTPLTYFW
jgi:hypothetical protein